MKIATVYQTKTRVKKAGRYLTQRQIVHKVDDRGSLSKLTVAMPAAWDDDIAMTVLSEALGVELESITVNEGATL